MDDDDFLTGRMRKRKREVWSFYRPLREVRNQIYRRLAVVENFAGPTRERSSADRLAAVLVKPAEYTRLRPMTVIVGNQ